MSSLNNSKIDPKSEISEVDLAPLLDGLAEHSLLIVIVTAIFATLGAMYAYLSPPVYETDMLVQVEDSPDNAAKDLLGDLSSVFDVKSSADSEMQILGSRLVVSPTVDQLKLYVSAEPVRFPLIGRWVSRNEKSLSHPGLLGMGGFAWGAESIDVVTFDVPSDLYDHRFELTVGEDGQYVVQGDDIEQFAKGKIGIPLTFATSGGQAHLLVRSISAMAGAAFTLKRQSRLQTIDDLQKRLNIQSIGKDSDIISASLQGIDRKRIAATLSELGTQYLKQNTARKSAQAEQSLQFLSEQEPEMKAELEAAEDSFNQYRNKHGIVDFDQEAKIVLQQSADFETQIFSLRQKRQELLTRFGDSHPAVKAIDEQVAAAQSQIDNISARIKSLPLDEQGAVRLQRDVRVNTDLYLAMRNNMEQLRLIKAGKVGNVRIVDGAYVPEKPVKPKKLLVIAAAALLGVICGVALAWLREQLFRGVTQSNTLEAYTGLKVIATIPKSRAQAALARKIDGLSAKSALLAVALPNDSAAEGLRSLRTAIQFSLFEARNNIVMISGPTPGVGKSFVCANLGEIFAASGKRVLLIDADMRRGYLNQYLGVERTIGLANVLNGTAAVANATLRAVRPNLDFLATGNFQANPSDLLTNGCLTRLFAEVAAQYDIVLLDTPPVLAVSDAEIISPNAGRVFLVAGYGKTRIGEIDECVKRITQSGAHVDALILNGVRSKRRFAHGGKYGSYNYVSYGYESRETKVATK